MARKEGKTAGNISWRIKVENSEFVVNSVEIKAASNIFENGAIAWTLSGDGDKRVEDIPSGNGTYFPYLCFFLIAIAAGTQGQIL